jgi:hypothetical protein
MTRRLGSAYGLLARARNRAHDLEPERLKKDAVENHQHSGVGAKKIVGNV